ncbi:hypothetical protein [Aliiruegeria lutimaris]|uniref:Uncharacterized protein n=1 Tax=Aliiruegeria lutimaris TaxID=571298 RepID=A0A1G9ILU7_9RHOB|nr:hypothetical protein [Aliiruegeria lutimaris]SDL26238.1 hypothetical protein SAMN04488026_107511 [Aliiruegeria lutimaris]
MRSYEAARSYFGFLEFLSWCVVGLGVIAALIGMGAASDMRGYGGASAGAIILAVMPGGALAFLGFLGLVFCQIGRANVDTAEYTQQGLKISREQLEISKQMLKQGAKSDQGYAAALQAAKDELRTGATLSASEPAGASYAAATKETAPQLKLDHEPGETIAYRGKEIRVVEGGYVLGGTIYPTYDKVMDQVDIGIDGYASERAASVATTGEDQEYRGTQIEKRDGGFYVGSNLFVSLERAQKHIDIGMDGVASEKETPPPYADQLGVSKTVQPDPVAVPVEAKPALRAAVAEGDLPRPMRLKRF